KCVEPKLGVNKGLLLSSKDIFTAYCDTDWAACTFSRKSVSGFTIQLWDSLISWKSKKQSIVSRSSAELEYRSLAFTVAKLTWIVGLITDLDVQVQLPVTIFSDSKAAIQMAANPMYHERTKHIEIGCHFIREKIQQGLIKTQYISTHDQPADVLTKSLNKVQHVYLISKLGLANLFVVPILRGEC
ncbi:hypothetical protein MTR67_008312, partial [Solanum verrucosum]